MKLLTVFDEKEPIDNVIPALTLDIDEVYYLYHEGAEEKTLNSIKSVLKKYKNIEIHFLELTDDKKEISNIINTNPGIIVDVGGSKYLSLVIFEFALSHDNPIIYYDNQENVLKEYRSHKIISEYVTRLSIEDMINLGGGVISRNMHVSPQLSEKETADAIYKAVDMSISDYNSFTTYVQKVSKMTSSVTKNYGNTYILTDDQLKEIQKGKQYKKCLQSGLFSINANTLTYLNDTIESMFEVSGTFLEAYTYLKLKSTNNFDEIIMSAVIDFSSKSTASKQIICELDLLVSQNNHLSFVSCKSNKITTSDVNEIKLHSLMFGNALSSATMCTLDDLSEKSPSVYAKAKELKVAVLDQTSYENEMVVKDFIDILNDRFEYEKLPN